MMKTMLDIRIPEPAQKIDYRDNIMLVGSCFTEHIGDALSDLKFKVLQNPHGILFDPVSVASSLVSYISDQRYTENDLFYLNEVWQSWQHHGRFSGVDKENVLQQINDSQKHAHQFLKSAKWLIITLGTSYSYRLTDGAAPVANCHRAPQGWFNKHLLSVEETIVALDNCLYRLFQFNENLEVIFTVSPVRHVRDGVVQNNRSKARLLESVHHLVDKFSRLHYFPSYELVIDVLRDHRYYDVDLVHPNFAATSFVIENFMKHYVNDESNALAREVQQIVMAGKHRAFHPQTEAHRNFLARNREKALHLMQAHPYLDLQQEVELFSKGS